MFRNLTYRSLSMPTLCGTRSVGAFRRKARRNSTRGYRFSTSALAAGVKVNAQHLVYKTARVGIEQVGLEAVNNHASRREDSWCHGNCMLLPSGVTGQETGPRPIRVPHVSVQRQHHRNAGPRHHADDGNNAKKRRGSCRNCDSVPLDPPLIFLRRSPDTHKRRIMRSYYRNLWI
jgi:hypothetical protein